MAKKLVFANNPLLSGPALNQREGAGIPYREVAVSSIDRDPNQPRVNFDQEKLEELSCSIKRYGVLNPITVRPGTLPGRYHLIAGERRLRAAKMAGLTSIPAMIDTRSDETGEQALAIQLVENLQRADLTPLERAHAIGALKEAYQLSVRDVAERLGISKSMVQRSLELLDLPDDLINALREGASESKILMLARISDLEERARLLSDLPELTRAQLQRVIGVKPEAKKPKNSSESLSPEDERITDEIQRALGLKVSMARTSLGSERGRLTIEFYSDADLQEVFRKLVTE